MNVAEKLAWARWLRKLPERTSLLRDDKERLLSLAGELEQDGLEEAVDETRPVREKL